MKLKRKYLITLLLTFLMLLLPLTVQAAKLNKTSVKISVKNTIQLQVKGLSGTEKIKWTSSDSSVAKVDKRGLVTALKKGQAIITAKVNGKKYRCKVTVYKPKLNMTSAKIKAGKKIQLEVTNTFGKIKWGSQDTSIATVNSKGVVTAKKPGKVIIYAKTGGKTLKCKVTVSKKKSSNESSSISDDSDDEESDHSINMNSLVWLSATGSKYHSYNSCGRMNPSRARLITLAGAIASGYGRCSNCW